MLFLFRGSHTMSSIRGLLFLVSVPLFLVVAFVSLFRSTNSGCLGVLGTVVVILVGLGVIAGTGFLV